MQIIRKLVDALFMAFRIFRLILHTSVDFAGFKTIKPRTETNKLRRVVLSRENRKQSILKLSIQCESWVCSKCGLQALRAKTNPPSVVAGGDDKN